jgi:hypothetical protein
MHLLIILQPTIESSMWLFLDGITFPNKILNQIAFWQISPPFDLPMRIVNSTWCNLIIEEDCWFIIWNPSSSPLVRDFAPSSLQASLSNVVCQYSTLLPTLSQGEGTRDSCVAIDRFQWPLLGHYLLEVYLAPHSLDSPCASHIMLAIKEHLVCGANSHCFGRAQKLSL